MKAEPGITLLTRLIDALGLSGHNVRKIVIVADIRDVARVYVERLMDTSEVPGIIGALEVTASEEINVNALTGEVTE